MCLQEADLKSPDEQEDVPQKTRKALEGRVEALKGVHEEHKQSEKERQMATRYHRVNPDFIHAVKLSIDPSIMPQ